MIEIVTKRAIDEEGIHLLRDDNCLGICIKGTEVPEICAHYHPRIGKRTIELCDRDENDDA